MSNYLTKINPLAKCMAVLIIAVILSFTYSIRINIFVFLVSMVLIITGSKKTLTALKFLLPTLFVAIGFLITGLYFGTGAVQEGIISVSSLGTGLNMGTRIFAFAGLGMVFSLTTDPLKFVQSLYRQAGLPRKFAYGLLCAFHLLPYLKQEYENARLAVEIRGIRLTPFSLKPIFSTLANSIRWSEALSIAMQSKGFDD